MNLPATKEISPVIINRFCPKKTGAISPHEPNIPHNSEHVTVYKNNQGEIGGYSVSTHTIDSAVTYFNCHGEGLGDSHIFNTREKQEKIAAIIEVLVKDFPIQEPLICPTE